MSTIVFARIVGSQKIFLHAFLKIVEIVKNPPRTGTQIV